MTILEFGKPLELEWIPTTSLLPLASPSLTYKWNYSRLRIEKNRNRVAGAEVLYPEVDFIFLTPTIKIITVGVEVMINRVCGNL